MAEDHSWTATRRVGIALGCGFTIVCILLIAGSLNEGDVATVRYLAAPASALGFLGTLGFAALPRRRIALVDGVLHIDEVPYPQARVSSIGERGEGFTTTAAFRIVAVPGGPELWLTKWSYPELDTVHSVLVGVLPMDALPEPGKRRGRLF